MAITKENIIEVNKKLETIDVKGKAYVQVNERVKAFREICPSGCISTEIISLDNGVVTMTAKITDENGMLLATGTAQEKETSSYINKTSFIENAETSAVGRALGFLGIGVDGSMASAEEVANAIVNQNKGTQKTDQAKKEEPKKEEPKKSEPPVNEDIDPVYLPTEDGVVTQAQWDKIASEMERTGIDEKVIISMVSNCKEIKDLTQSQVIAVLNKFSKTKDKQ